jgi:hypothetical protein
MTCSALYVFCYCVCIFSLGPLHAGEKLVPFLSGCFSLLIVPLLAASECSASERFHPVLKDMLLDLGADVMNDARVWSAGAARIFLWGVNTGYLMRVSHAGIACADEGVLGCWEGRFAWGLLWMGK